jgi:hypothetical protein
MPTALFVVSIYNYHREVLPVIENFSRNGWRVVVVLGWRGESAEEAAATYAARGCAVEWVPEAMAYRGGTPRSTSIPAAPPVERPVARKLSVVRRLIGLARILWQMIAVRRWVVRFMNRAQPDVVLSGPFHSIGKFDNAFLLTTRRHALPHCCYPFSPYIGRKNATLARFGNLAIGMLSGVLSADYDLLNRLLAKSFPHWTTTRGGTTIFMFDPLEMLAGWWTGMMDRDVWQTPSPTFDKVFVFSKYSSDLLAASDFPMDLVAVSGYPLLDDVVARASDTVARSGLRADLGLGPGEAFILFNVEPSAEHHYCDWDKHWQNFRAMMEIMKKPGLPVVLSLHPLCRIEDYLFAEKEYGVRISRTWTIYDLYPDCRFAVSFACSTNHLAEMFNKPLVIYDFFNMAHSDSPRADDFRLPGALVGHNFAEIEADVRQLAAATASTAPLDGAAVSPAPTFVPASDAIRRHVEDLLNSAKIRSAVT